MMTLRIPRRQAAGLTTLMAAPILLSGCSSTAKDTASFCLTWPGACVAAAVIPQHSHPADRDCTHQPKTPPLPDPVRANSVVLLDIDAINWFNQPIQAGIDSTQGRDGRADYSVFNIEVALLWTHFQFLELKAPGSDKESYIKAGYSELSRGSNPQYLRASIRLAGSPGCEVYEETMKRQGHGTLNFLEETQCVALEPEDVAVSRYAFTSGKPTDLSKGIQMRELVDLSTGKVHAEYFRDYSYGSNCPRGDVRQQFTHLVQPIELPHDPTPAVVNGGYRKP